jgi:hypothetical protein
MAVIWLKNGALCRLSVARRAGGKQPVLSFRRVALIERANAAAPKGEYSMPGLNP